MTRVSVTTKDHIAFVTMTRSDKMNALDMEMIEALIAAGEDLKTREDIRVIVLSGEGDAFCAGLDVTNFSKFAQADPTELLMPRSHGDTNLFQQVSMVWRQITVPVIAALQGVCYGGGMQIAMGADIRIAHPDTKLSIMEMKWGLVPDMGGMTMFAKSIASDQLRKLIYTNAPVTAQEAQRIGLVTDLAPDALTAATQMAQTIAGKSPSAIKAAKRLIAYAESGASGKDILLEESREQADLIGKPHQMEVIMANMQKRPAKFD